MKKKYGVDKSVWPSLKRMLQNIALSISERPIRIIDIPESEGELGYTSEGNRVHIAPVHPIMKGLSKEECVMFVKGIFVHELLHQLATDFKTYMHMLDKLPRSQKSIFATLFNVMEDPAIEHQASHFLGGHLLNALRFTVMHCYRSSPNLSGMSPFQELVAALCQYGDGGILKGSFSSPETRACFCKIVPLYDRAIVEPNATKRLHYALDAFELSRPLWEPEVKEAEEMEKLMSDLMQSFGKGMNQAGDGTGTGGFSFEEEEAAPREESAKEKRRKITYKEVSREELEAAKAGAKEGGPVSETEDLLVLYTREKSKEKSEEEASDSEKGSVPGKSETPKSEKEEMASGSPETKSEPSEEEESPKEISSAGETPSEESKDSAEDETDAEPRDKNSEAPSEIMSSAGSTSGDGVISEEEYELSPEDAEMIAEEMAAFEREGEIEARAAKEHELEDLDVPELTDVYPSVSCLNRKITLSGNPELYADAYESIVAPMRGDISFLVGQLKRIFRNEAEDREYRASGRVSVKRLNEGRLTSRVFQRKRLPGNRSDLCVELLIDESGSMHGSRIQCARKCAIGLAETFAALHIPVKIIGFTSDVPTGERNYDVVHDHYTSWANSKAERYSLLNISAQRNNFDGYSIRYAEKVIAKRREEHKLLIVISDGQPACHYYPSYSSGYSDTKNAIKDATKKVDVLGVAIGTSDTEILFSMYGQHFLHISNERDLFSAIGKKIQAKVKTW